MIDSKGKLFGKISIIDLVIVLVVIAAIAGVGYKLTQSKVASGATEHDIKTVLYLDELYTPVAETLKAGDVVKESIQGANFGKVTDIKLDKSVSWYPNTQGAVVKSSKDGYNSVTLTIQGKGIVGTNGVSIGNYNYYIGKTLEFRVGNTAIYAKITAISKIG